jgi:hypothetical protein
LKMLSVSGGLRLTQRTFWEATPCSLVDIYQGFVTTYCLCPLGRRLSRAGGRAVSDVSRGRTVTGANSKSMGAVENKLDRKAMKRAMLG